MSFYEQTSKRQKKGSGDKNPARKCKNGSLAGSRTTVQNLVGTIGLQLPMA